MVRVIAPPSVMNGGRNRTRTCDPLVVIQVLYQLSYPPGFGPRFAWCPPPGPPRVPRSAAGPWAHLDSNQGLAGYEPAALDR